MGWARIDDGFHDHPKLMGLSLEAVGLWTLTLTWARRHHRAGGGRPGFVPKTVPARFAGNRGVKLAFLLESHGLWDETDGGWTIHDYDDYLSAADRTATTEDVRKARSSAGKRGAEARWADSNSKAGASQDDGNLPLDSDGKPMPPSRPVPTQPPPSVVEPHKRGHRLSENWRPTPADIDWARDRGITDDAARRSTERFQNHWLDATGKTATKLDWSRAWRNWLDNDAERAAQHRPATATDKVVGIGNAAQQAKDMLRARQAQQPHLELPPGA